MRLQQYDISFLANAQVFQRLDRIEYKQIESDHRIEELFRKIDERSITPNQGIFFDGQIYDAYEFICGLIKSAKTRIILIDNYVDETVLTMLDKREAGGLTVFFRGQLPGEHIQAEPEERQIRELYDQFRNDLWTYEIV